MVQVKDAAWIWRCCGCGCRLAAAVPVQLLAWDPPYALALKKWGKKRERDSKQTRAATGKRGLSKATSLAPFDWTELVLSTWQLGMHGAGRNADGPMAF